MQHPSRLAETALVAAKVYEAYGWVRWHGRGHDLGCDAGFHVPDAEEILAILVELRERALATEEPFQEICHTRWMARRDEDGGVDFFLGIGDDFYDRSDT
jgi:hypothetical protein